LALDGLTRGFAFKTPIILIEISTRQSFGGHGK
jgi:hypothetical protein